MFLISLLFLQSRRHGAAMLVDSNFLQDMQHFTFSPWPWGRPLCVYGVPVYPLRVRLQAPVSNRMLSPQITNFNKALSSVRVSVDWLFGDIVDYLKFVNLKKNLKIDFSSTGKMYIMFVPCQETH